MAKTSFNVKFKNDSVIVDRNVRQALQAAADEIRERSIEWIQEKMLYGYHDPHGADGHTEIVDTGATFDSVDAKVQQDSQNTFTVTAGVNTDYAVFVHNGTRKLKGRPFIRDAMIENTTNIKRILQEHASDAAD